MVKLVFLIFLIFPIFAYEYSEENFYDNAVPNKNIERNDSCSGDVDSTENVTNISSLGISTPHVENKNYHGETDKELDNQTAVQENSNVEKKVLEQSFDPQNENTKDGYFNEEAPLMKIESVKIQILDKISGKIFKEVLVLDQPKKFGTITITLKNAYQNNPEDDKEIYALINIKEHGKIIFEKWLFASSPAINLMKHAVYDVRIEN